MKKQLLLLVSCSFFFNIIVIQAIQANLITNFAFTDNVNDWGALSGSISHNTDGYSEAGSIRIDSEDFGFPIGHKGSAYYDISSPAEDYYYFRVYGKCDVTTGFNIKLHWQYDVSSIRNDDITVPTADGSWQIITGEVDSPANPTQVTIWLECQDDDAALCVFYDDVYFDTSSPPAVSEGLLNMVIPLFGGLIVLHILIRKKKE
ncbi:MAG: hypothetical protein ACTSP4_06040 [Candidatus Hodarchaeales archaeon]